MSAALRIANKRKAPRVSSLVESARTSGSFSPKCGARTLKSRRRSYFEDAPSSGNNSESAAQDVATPEACPARRLDTFISCSWRRFGFNGPFASLSRGDVIAGGISRHNKYLFYLFPFLFLVARSTLRAIVIREIKIGISEYRNIGISEYRNIGISEYRICYRHLTNLLSDIRIFC
jgi:hypothetical protein